MKISKNLREIVLAIGVILIALRLFFPVKEVQLFSEGNRLKPSVLTNPYDINKFEKTIVVSKTVLQSLGISVLTGGFILLYNLNRKQNS